MTDDQAWLLNELDLIDGKTISLILFPSVPLNATFSPIPG